MKRHMTHSWNIILVPACGPLAESAPSPFMGLSSSERLHLTTLVGILK